MVLLLTSELVTNDLRHGASPISLKVERFNGRVRVSVGDGDPYNAPVVSPEGNGLVLVEELADAWDGRSLPGSARNVWFTLG